MSAADAWILVNGKFVIDTNTLIKFIAHDPTLRWRMGHDFRCFLSFISVGELFAGAYQSTRKAINVAEVQRFCHEIPVLIWDFETADTYGRIHASLRRKGKPIPHNDVWVAATALRHEMTLITLDKHFAAIEGLRTEVW